MRTFTNRGDLQKQLKEADDKLAEIEQTKWKDVAVELNGEDPYRFLRAYSPGEVAIRCRLTGRDLRMSWTLD